jgi:hypothetical protein
MPTTLIPLAKEHLADGFLLESGGWLYISADRWLETYDDPGMGGGADLGPVAEEDYSSDPTTICQRLNCSGPAILCVKSTAQLTEICLKSAREEAFHVERWVELDSSERAHFLAEVAQGRKPEAWEDCPNQVFVMLMSAVRMGIVSQKEADSIELECRRAAGEVEYEEGIKWMTKLAEKEKDDEESEEDE